jgi:hypothetical protein
MLKGAGSVRLLLWKQALTKERRSLEPDEMRIDGQLQDFGSPSVPTGSVCRGDQIPQSQILGFDRASGGFCFMECFHFGWNGGISPRNVSLSMWSSPPRQAREIALEIRSCSWRQKENRCRESPAHDRRRCHRGHSRGESRHCKR